MNSNQKNPLSPQQLFQRLRNSDFRQAECQDEASRLRMQREILIQLILQYQDQIKQANSLSIEQARLLEIRERLLIELETLRNQRALIDSKVAQELANLRLQPMDKQNCASWTEEITESRTRNNKLRIRIKDMMNYVQKLEYQNRCLEEERRTISTSEITRRQMGEDWRLKIQALKRQQFSYETEIREKIRTRQQNALKSIQAQELQIRERNQRRRMETMHSKVSTPIHQIYNKSYIREV